MPHRFPFLVLACTLTHLESLRLPRYISHRLSTESRRILAITPSSRQPLYAVFLSSMRWCVQLHGFSIRRILTTCFCLRADFKAPCQYSPATNGHYFVTPGFQPYIQVVRYSISTLNLLVKFSDVDWKSDSTRQSWIKLHFLRL